VNDRAGLDPVILSHSIRDSDHLACELPTEPSEHSIGEP